MTSHNTNLMTNRLMRPDCLFILSRTGTLTSLCNATERELREGHNKDVYGSVKKCVQEIDAQFAGNRYYEYCYQANYRKIVKSERTFKYISEYANINKIKKILLAYKLFYVGCSRAKKGIDDSWVDNKQKVESDYIEIRYAEVLLTYAEAMIELTKGKREVTEDDEREADALCKQYLERWKEEQK